MAQRIAFGSVAIVAILAVVMLDAGIADWCSRHALDTAWGELLSRGSVIPVVWLALILAAAAELNRILKAKGARPHTLFACVMIGLLVLAPWISAAGCLGHRAAEVEGLYWLVVGLLLGGAGTGVLAITRRQQEGMLRDSGATLLMIVYLGFFGAFALQLRCGRGAPGQDGAWLLLITVLITKSSDIGAYFIGSRLGRHRLCPTISPGKTVEGAIGGLAASAVLSVGLIGAPSLATQLGAASPWPALTEFLSAFSRFLDDATRAFSMHYQADQLSPTVRALLFGVAMSAAGQIGDLFESGFKRDAGLKDSGKVIPRFGGILDLVDSPLFAIPVGWFLLTAVWAVG